MYERWLKSKFLIHIGMTKLTIISLPEYMTSKNYKQQLQIKQRFKIKKLTQGFGLKSIII